MHYRIIGTRTASGEHAELTIEADSPEGARRLAQEQGLHAERIEPLTQRKRIQMIESVSGIGDEPPTSRTLDDGRDKPILVRLDPRSVQTIQRTGKRWKALLLVGSLMMLAGA